MSLLFYFGNSYTNHFVNGFNNKYGKKDHIILYLDDSK